MLDVAKCVDKEEYDKYASFEGKCKGSKEEKLFCVCNTDLCNNGKEDDESGVGMVVPQITMIFVLSYSVNYFTM